MKSLLAIGVAIVLLILGKIFFFSGSDEKMATPNQPTNKGKQSPVLTSDIYLALEQNNSNEIFSSGTMIANEEVELRSEASGRITALNIKEGASINKGQLIAKLFDENILAQLKKLKFEEELAEQVEARQKKLLDINAISKEEFDIAVNKVNTLRADKESLQVALKQTEVRAPFSGRIGLKNISVGAYVTPANIIATLVQTNPIKMDFTIPEKYSDKISVGRKISFSTDGKKDEYTATVIAIDPKVDETLRTLKVRTTIPNPKNIFLPGMFVRVNASLGATKSIMIPTETVIPVMGGKSVYVLKEGKAKEVSVTTGLRTERFIEITDGVSIGDSVIATGLMSLKPGTAVKVKNILNQ